MEKTYLTAAETAKLLRKDLKKNFPGVKFSVRSDNNSINVSYVDGPLKSAVDSVAKAYEGGGFDGSIDLAYYNDHFLNTLTGEVCIAGSGGSENSGGYDPCFENEMPKGEGWTKVSFGSKYVFVSQSFSVDVLKDAIDDASKYWGFDAGCCGIQESDYGNSLNTEMLLASQGYSQESRMQNNSIYEFAGYFAAGNYFLN